MKLTVTTQVTEEIEVEGEFPLFFSQPPYVYKMLSQKEFISVIHYDGFSASIERSTNKGIADNVFAKGTIITENKFLDTYVNAFNEIQKLIYSEEVAGIECDLTNDIVPRFR